jgi:hypothetical protein
MAIARDNPSTESIFIKTRANFMNVGNSYGARNIQQRLFSN